MHLPPFIHLFLAGVQSTVVMLQSRVLCHLGPLLVLLQDRDLWMGYQGCRHLCPYRLYQIVCKLTLYQRCEAPLPHPLLLLPVGRSEIAGLPAK